MINYEEVMSALKSKWIIRLFQSSTMRIKSGYDMLATFDKKDWICSQNNLPMR